MQRLSKSWAGAAAACGATVTVLAQPVPAALQACVRITQDGERLACFDREMAALSGGTRSSGTARSGSAAASTGMPAANSVAAASAAAPAASAAAPAASAAAPAASAAAPAASAAAPLTPAEEMGLSPEGIRKLEAKKGVTPPETAPPKELTAHLTSVSRNSAGRDVFTLDNGQVWRQSETRARFEAHAGQAVKITPGAVGSFWLSTDTHNWTRVERVP